MTKLAIMIDGGFFLKRLKYAYPDADKNDPKAIADLIFRHALRHTNQRTGTERGPTKKGVYTDYDLYRIFFYDCPPIEKKMHQPITSDFSKNAS